MVSDTVMLAWARLIKAQSVLLSAVEKDLKCAGFPSLVWYDALLELKRAGDKGLRPVVLEASMLLAQYSTSRLLDKLEAAGLITKRACCSDARGFEAVITQEGLALQRRMWPYYARSVERHMGQRLSQEEALQLAQILRLLLSRQVSDDLK